MGFRKPDLEAAYSAIRHSIGTVRSSYTDGFIGEGCKHELYQLKCWLEDQYAELPTFANEKDWEQERIVKILKQE
jgi:hypothetical protein